MKSVIYLIVIVAIVVCSAFPQGELGGAITEQEAIQRAQQAGLIGRDDQVLGVSRALELGAWENIQGKVDLNQYLGQHLPSDVIADLQQRIDQYEFQS